MNSDISYLSSSSDLSLQEAPNPSVPVENQTQNNVHTNQESIQALLNNFSEQQKKNVNSVSFLKKNYFEMGYLNYSLFDLQ
jgi:TolA-binding protein